MDRVLVIDDEKGMRDFLAIMLKKEGYAVVVSESADKASELVGKGEFDLVISDIAMPGKSGIEILKQTKAIQRALDKFNSIVLERHLDGCVTTAIRGADVAERERVIHELLQVFETSSKV